MCHITTARILLVAECVDSNYVFWDWEKNHKVGLGTHWAHYEMNLSHVLVIYCCIKTYSKM